MAAPRMACHLHYVASHRTTGVTGGPVLLVAGARGSRVGGGDYESVGAGGGGDSGTDGGGYDPHSSLRILRRCA